MTLEEENAALRAENDALRAENDALRAELEHLSVHLSSLREQVDQLAAALHTAQARIAELEAKQTPPPAFVKANTPERPKQPRKKRAPEQNHARRLETPTQIIEHRLECCPACQGRLSGVYLARRRQVIDLPPPPPVQVTEHQVFRGWCSFCQSWREAPLNLSGQVLGQGRIGVGIACLVAHLRLVVRAPLRVIQAWVASVHGLRLSVGEISDLLRRVAAHGQAVLTQVRARIRASPVVQADETGWRENGHNGYVWFAGTPAGERYFEYHHSRAGAIINTLLGDDFSGVLASDFSAAYNDTPGGQHQRCWAHLLRDLHALKVDHASSLDVVLWAKAVKEVYLLAKAWLAQGRERHRAYGEAVLLIRALGEQFAQAKGHPCQALAKRLLRHQDELFVFLRQPGVPADNNLAERSLRPLVIARKISGGTRSQQGSQTRMTLTSLFQTWQACGLNPLHECFRLLQCPFPQL
jgi:transposase